ncbi:hypothetical protein KRP22_001560 [Phytophthora ramorum]|nr:hypothetical protein KRP22_7035 [Phytophthora ramorum]KAH7509338.1 hypothetical protein KRP22_839 [Phytophthora ramorum]KAH7509340.1 hypothetical protein KRP22_841 [Phytophthora ramorum]
MKEIGDVETCEAACDETTDLMESDGKESGWRDVSVMESFSAGRDRWLEWEQESPEERSSQLITHALQILLGLTGGREVSTQHGISAAQLVVGGYRRLEAACSLLQPSYGKAGGCDLVTCKKEKRD